MLILALSISRIDENYPKLAKIPLLYIDLPFHQKLPFSQCAQNTKQFISVDSPSWAKQNGTNSFVVACTVVEIFTLTVRLLKARFLWFLQRNISATEHDMTKIITSFHSESPVHYDINISYCPKIPKIGENPLIIDLPFHQKFLINVLKALNNSYQ